jgi:hypothetical protein
MLALSQLSETMTQRKHRLVKRENLMAPKPKLLVPLLTPVLRCTMDRNLAVLEIMLHHRRTKVAKQNKKSIVTPRLQVTLVDATLGLTSNLPVCVPMYVMILFGIQPLNAIVW